MACGADSVEFVLVMLHEKSVAFGNAVLEVLDPGLFEFGDGAAAHANEVIVVAVFVGKFVSCVPIVELAFVHDVAFREHLHGSIHGRITDARIGKPDLLEKGVDREVLVPFKERVDDQAPLLGGAQPATGHVGVEARSKYGEVFCSGHGILITFPTTDRRWMVKQGLSRPPDACVPGPARERKPESGRDKNACWECEGRDEAKRRADENGKRHA